MESVISYDEFVSKYYEECRNADWFPDVLADCYDLDTTDETVSSLVGCIHEGLRKNFQEAIKFFWTVFLINPLIAIKAYQETDLLLGRIDVYESFKHISPVDPISNSLKEKTSGIYNTSVEYFLIFAMEALLQKDMNPEILEAVNRTYLRGLYNHDKEIMGKKLEDMSSEEDLPGKWINHRNLLHILNGIDPHHIIILLEFFADKYGARLKKGNVGKNCYSRDKYNYIISFIAKKYGSLSEYILWDHVSYGYHYVNYYKRSLCYTEMFKNMDIIFPTMEDKLKIQKSSEIPVSDPVYRKKRMINKLKNPNS